MLGGADNSNGEYALISLALTTAGDGYIHVLVEHQSTPDKHMAFRLIRYAVAAMQRHLEAGHKKLPLVIPVLFYTGKRSPYPYSTRWLDEFDDPSLAGKLYSSAFPLVDVTVIPDDEIAGHRSMAALTSFNRTVKHASPCPADCCKVISHGSSGFLLCAAQCLKPLCCNREAKITIIVTKNSQHTHLQFAYLSNIITFINSGR